MEQAGPTMSAAAAKRQRTADGGALVAALRQQIESLESENAALRSARRLLADEDRTLTLQAANKRLRAERRKLDDEMRDLRSAVSTSLITVVQIAVLGRGEEVPLLIGATVLDLVQEWNL